MTYEMISRCYYPVQPKPPKSKNKSLNWSTALQTHCTVTVDMLVKEYDVSMK